MIVTIWRHGEAGRATSDRKRELTGTGTDDIAYGCHQLHETCLQRGVPQPQLLLHSSWLRTTQTAEIIASAFTHARVKPLQALIPGCAPVEVDRALEGLEERDRVPHLVLVSHQPLVSRLVDHYLGLAGRVPALTPGGLVTLSLEVPAPGCGQLLFWALPPGFEAHV